MRRRTLLATATATAIGALAGLKACSGTFGKSAPGPTPSIAPMPTPSRTPRPSPPTDTAVPSYFSDQAVWPNTRVQTNATITALHGQHLCGMIPIPELQETVSGGYCPVVVDLKGPTTWALTPDSKGNWSAALVDLAASSTPEAEASASPTTTATPVLPEISVATGPAVMDDTHAYLVAGVYYDDSRVDYSYRKSVTCAIDVVKVSTSDYAIAASARLVEEYKFSGYLLDRVSLNFNADRSALLVAGSKDPDTASARGFGFRLSTADLSTQFDASTILTGSYQEMDAKGEALTAMDEKSKSIFVYLANGTTETTESEWRIERVQDDWIYYCDVTRITPGAYDTGDLHMRNLTTGESIALSHQREHFRNMYTFDIYTGQHEVILYGTYTKPAFSVRQPGATTPMLSWTSDERAVPRAACVFGDIAYMTTPDRPEYKGNATLQLTSLTSGQDIGQVPIDTDNGPIAVSAWGLALQGAFYPANGWMDHPEHSTPSDAPEETATATATAT